MMSWRQGIVRGGRPAGALAREPLTRLGGATAEFFVLSCFRRLEERPLKYERHQYPIIRPAVIAVSHETSETPPITASCRRSLAVNSRSRRARHAGDRLSTSAFSSPTPIAGNLM